MPLDSQEWRSDRFAELDRAIREQPEEKPSRGPYRSYTPRKRKRLDEIAAEMRQRYMNPVRIARRHAAAHARSFVRKRNDASTTQGSTRRMECTPQAQVDCAA